MRVQDIDIVGVSKSGFATAIALPQFKICFDCGIATPEAVRCDTVLFTHGHIDHFGGFAQHAHTREMISAGTAVYYMPKHMVSQAVDLIAKWASIQGQTPAPVGCYALEPGESGRAGKRLVRSFPTHHRGGQSQGYIVYDVKKKLKEEYQGLPGKELGRLRKEGVDFEDVVEVPLVAFSGDTRPGIFQVPGHPALKAKVLLIECTYLDDVPVSKGAEWGHIHIDELRKLALKGLFNDVGSIVLCHFSQRYDDSMVEEAIKTLPEHLDVHFLSMGG